MSSGPSAQYRSNLQVHDPKRYQERVYETNQKYQEYLAQLGSQQLPTNAYQRMNRVPNFENVQYLIDPAKISPLLKSLDDENKQLKNECQKLSNDIVSLTSMVEKLIDDNSQIKKHLDLKQLEMQHFLQSKQLNLNEVVGDYKLQIASLQDENNVLIKHLEEMRKNTGEEMINNLQTELSNANELYNQLQMNFEMCQEREQDLARQFNSMRSSYNEKKEQAETLQNQLDQAENKIELQQNELIQLRTTLDISTNSYKDKINSRQLELDELQFKLNSLQREYQLMTQQYHVEKAKNLEILKENHRLLQETNNFQQISDELYAKGKDLKTQLDLEKLKKQQIINPEYIPKQEEFKLLVQQLEQAKLEYIKLDDFMNKQLEDQKNQTNFILDNMKSRYNVSLKERAEQIQMLERQIDQKNEENDLLKKELQLLHTELTGVKNQNVDYVQIKRIVDQQSMDIRILRTQLQDKKTLVQEMLDEKDKLNKLLKKESSEHKLHIAEYEEKLNEMEQYYKKVPQIQIELDRMIMQNQELSEVKIKLQEQYKDVQILCKQLNDQNSQLKVDNGVLESQVNLLREQVQTYQLQQQRKDKLDQVMQENHILRAQLNK